MEDPDEQNSIEEPTEQDLIDWFNQEFPIILRNAHLSQRANLRMGIILTMLAVGVWLAANWTGEHYPARPGDIHFDGLLKIIATVTAGFGLAALAQYLFWRPRLARVPSDPGEAFTSREALTLMDWFRQSPREYFISCFWQCAPPLAGLIVFSVLLSLMIFVFTRIWTDAPGWVSALAFAVLYGATGAAIFITHRRARACRQ